MVRFKKSDPQGRPCQDTIEGFYLKRKLAGEVTDEDTGEVKERFTLIFETEDGDKFQVWETAGLKSALAMSDVAEGDYIKIVHLGKIPRGNGKTGEVNQYDVFTL